MLTCSVEGCGSKILARGLCGRHYQRWLKHGDTSVVLSRKLHMPWITDVAIRWKSKECLPWPFGLRGGRRPQDTYPALGSSGYAHVLLCEMVHGKRPTPKHEAEHMCGLKVCMNPKHIHWATHIENCARRTAHGTQTVGEQHGMARLTESDVRAIRSAPVKRGSGKALAAQYGVTPSMISNIRVRKAWKHI